jgi:ABC-2 type transport system permease protein
MSPILLFGQEKLTLSDILMSGLFTPIESMPAWAQVLTDFNPIKYFVEVIRIVMLKGSSFQDILPQIIKQVFILYS